MNYCKLVKEGLEFSITFSLIILVSSLLRYQREIDNTQIVIAILMMTFQFLVVGPLAVKIKEKTINE